MAEPTLQEVMQAAQQAAQAASEAAQAVTQSAQQVAEQIGQSVSQAISKVLQSQTQTTGATMVAGREELGDIGGTESIESDLISQGRIVNANIKRTYDEYQHEGLESIRRSRIFADQIVQNAITHAKALDTQAIRHHDIAIDRQWNLDEQAWATEAVLNTIKPTLESVVAKILADMAANPAPATPTAK